MKQTNPLIIQGGMGAGVSNWHLARAVSVSGHLGVVSGTALDVILARRLQQGDPDGHIRRAMEQFPIPDVRERILRRYFIPGGLKPGIPYRSIPLYSNPLSLHSQELLIMANFVEVCLAKEGHTGLVGINYLYKIQLPLLPALYGAMLAKADYVLVGAGIPLPVPGVMDNLAKGKSARMKLDVEGAEPGECFYSEFDPSIFKLKTKQILNRPKFLAIISSSTLAITMKKRADGPVDGFVVEGALAGGHNAPPRGPMTLNEQGEPVYGPRDNPNLKKIQALGLPYWLAGDFSSPNRLKEALHVGAAGIQVGTAFAFCDESGIEAGLKDRVRKECLSGKVEVVTHPTASPTGFPFKIIGLSGTLSEQAVYEKRKRICDIGNLRHSYRTASGNIGFRCPGELIPQYLAKGGKLEETVSRRCICNGLLSTIGLGQVTKDGNMEPPLLTSGSEIKNILRPLLHLKNSYTASDVIQYLCPQSA